jgi:hypothetical protein
MPSPVVSGNRVVVIARQGDQEIVRALDLASGQETWRATYPAPYTVNSAAWDTRARPEIDSGHFWGPRLHAWDQRHSVGVRAGERQAHLASPGAQRCRLSTEPPRRRSSTARASLFMSAEMEMAH